MSEEPLKEDDQKADAEFQRVLSNLVHTPHKPHSPKAKPRLDKPPNPDKPQG